MTTDRPEFVSTVTLFTRPNCHLCDDMKRILEHVAKDVPFDLEIIDIDAPGNEDWQDQYDREIPVLHIDGKQFARHRVDEKTLRHAITTA